MHYRLLMLICLFVTSIFVPLTGYAWNAVGHMLVAKIAYDRLKPSVKAKVNIMVHDLNKEYPNVTNFEEMAVWPDHLRFQRINIFTHWHYTDVAFSDDGTALKNLVDTDNAIWALNQIKVVVQNNQSNPFERARFLAFLIHIVGDVHQPLHTVSRISAAHPAGDEGGNLFLINYKEGVTQIKNLHQLWDGGVGAFEFNPETTKIDPLAKSITSHYSEAFFGSQILDVDPTDWAKEGYQLATNVVYKIPENERPITSYIISNQQVAQQRVALAGYRLAELLNELLG